MRQKHLQDVGVNDDIIFSNRRADIGQIALALIIVLFAGA